MYKVTVNLLPQDATLAEKQQVLSAVHADKETILQSADDAVLLVNSGSAGSRVKVWWQERWQDNITAFLLDNGVQIVDHYPVPPPIPPPNQPMFGLHARSDPGDISQQEVNEFSIARIEVAKVLSAHSGSSVSSLASLPSVKTLIIRAFLDFGGRNVTPDDFFNWCKDDVIRTLDNAQGKDVILELHNEPNLAPEGWGTSWMDGYTFGAWLDALRGRFEALRPSLRLMYPGLSPGGYIPGLRQDHVQFIEQSRQAVMGMDALGVHVYWSDVFPMSAALSVLDDYIARFPGKEIWVTEASHNQAGKTPQEKAQQYIQFYNALKNKPGVRGVTYYVASASNPAFGWQGGSCETWLAGESMGIGKAVAIR